MVYLTKRKILADKVQISSYIKYNILHLLKSAKMPLSLGICAVLIGLDGSPICRQRLPEIILTDTNNFSKKEELFVRLKSNCQLVCFYVFSIVNFIEKDASTAVVFLGVGSAFFGLSSAFSNNNDK